MDAPRLWWLQDQYEILIVTKNLHFSSYRDSLVDSIPAFTHEYRVEFPIGEMKLSHKLKVSFLIIEEQLPMLKFFRHGYNTYTKY